MNARSVILFETTHEQSLPTFHVREDLSSKFISYLERSGFALAEPVKPLGTGEMNRQPMVEILMVAGTPVKSLQEVMGYFVRSLDK